MAKLRLKKELLAELTTDEMHQVAAAGVAQETLLACASFLTNCQSVNFCTTAMSCGCRPTWNCQ